MSTILVNNVKSYTGDTVTISGSNILVHGNTTLGDGVGTDIITVKGDITASNSMTISGSIVPSSGAGDISTLGISTKKWNTLYTETLDGGGTIGVSSSLNMSGSVYPYIDAPFQSFNLGSPTKHWSNLYVSRSNSIQIYTQTISASALPTSEAAAGTNELYTISGSQLPFSGSITDLNAISASLFVMIKA
tara:strand:- start:39 stop:608 length:570 start_codon:yes stop_codon:yes gene_type:complete